MSNARDEFDNASEYVSMKDLLGELVLFTPTEYVEEVKTDFGTKDAVLADLVVLTQEGQPTYDQAMILQGSLIGMLKRKIPVEGGTVRESDGSTRVVSPREGRKLLGVLFLGDAKKGQQAPYKLAAPTDEQKQMARDYLAGRTVQAATETPAEAPAADPWAVSK